MTTTSAAIPLETFDNVQAGEHFSSMPSGPDLFCAQWWYRLKNGTTVSWPHELYKAPWMLNMCLKPIVIDHGAFRDLKGIPMSSCSFCHTLFRSVWVWVAFVRCDSQTLQQSQGTSNRPSQSFFYFYFIFCHKTEPHPTVSKSLMAFLTQHLSKQVPDVTIFTWEKGKTITTSRHTGSYLVCNMSHCIIFIFFYFIKGLNVDLSRWVSWVNWLYKPP